MAKRTRRRTRSRNRRRQPDQLDSQQSFSSSNVYIDGSNQYLAFREPSSGHWQSQWEAWQTRRLSASAAPFVSHRATDSMSSITSIWSINQSRPSTASSSHSSPPAKRPATELSVVEHRLRMFGGEVDDGLALCEPMMGVVRRLFDGKLDYMDP